MVRSGLVWHPEMFHGRGRRTSAFDGWYFKIVDAEERFVRAIIPGVWMDRDPAKQYCFIQVLDGRTGRTTMHRYPFEQFWSSRERFDIVCGHSRFSLTDVHVDIDESDLHLEGDLKFSQSQGWPIRPLAPGAMGPFAFLPFLERYHGILSLDPCITGSLDLEGDEITFSGGKGYIENDWGSGFSRAWVWTQCNHFDEDRVCLTASIADIPLAGRLLRGIIVAFLYEGVLYQWTTWNGARLAHFACDDEHVEFTVTSGRCSLEVWSGGCSGMGRVFAPRGGIMAKMLVEELNAVVQVRLVDHAGSSVATLFEGKGRHAGLEISGDMTTLAGVSEGQPVQGLVRP